MNLQIIEHDGGLPGTKFYTIRDQVKGFFQVEKQADVIFTRDFEYCARFNNLSNAEDMVSRINKLYDKKGRLLPAYEKILTNGGGEIPDDLKY